MASRRILTKNSSPRDAVEVRISKRRRICVSAGHRRSSLRLPLLGAPCPNGAAAACAQTIAPYASNPQAIRMAWTIKAALCRPRQGRQHAARLPRRGARLVRLVRPLRPALPARTRRRCRRLPGRGPGLSVSTLTLRRAAIRYLHVAAGCPVPNAEAAVGETMAGITRHAAETGDTPRPETRHHRGDPAPDPRTD